jgi:hypothetical protein
MDVIGTGGRRRDKEKRRKRNGDKETGRQEGDGETRRCYLKKQFKLERPSPIGEVAEGG